MDIVLNRINLPPYTLHHLPAQHPFIHPIVNGKAMASDCHRGYTDENAEAIVAYKGAEIVSYLVYTVDEVSVHIDFSCTKIDERRRGLSVLLRAILFQYAINNRIPYIVSNCNESSGGLLSQKFGFSYAPEGILEAVSEAIGEEVNCAVQTDDIHFVTLVESVIRKYMKP